MTLSVQPAIALFDTARGEACGVAPVGVADPTFFAPITKAQREAGGVRALATNDAGEMVAPDGTVGGVPVVAVTDLVTGGIGIIGPNGKQVGGTASPYAFTTRTLAETDNGQTRVCASAQVATVNASMPVGFGVAFKGAISFTAGSGVTISDVRTTGAANPWCALTQTGVDTYDVLGTKA